MATLSVNYAADAQLTITLASLGSSADHSGGRKSLVVDNTTNKFFDVIQGRKNTCGIIADVIVRVDRG